MPITSSPTNSNLTPKNGYKSITAWRRDESGESKKNMRRRARAAGANGSGGGSSAELLLCFPSSSHIALTPKPICSPSRPANLARRHPPCRVHSSPLFRSKTGSHFGSGSNSPSAATDDITDEPTSPKVTCAGQIKIRPRSRSGGKPTTSSGREGKGWLSVTVEMERLHRHGKKPLIHFFGALRSSLRFDLRCFGSFHGTVDCSTDEGASGKKDEEEEQEDKDLEKESRASRTIFSKWFMMLEQNQSHDLNEDMEKEVNAENLKEEEEKELKEHNKEEAVPPRNALLLMRCRSAPSKGERRISTEEEEVEVEKVRKKKERLLLMSYAPDFTKLSTEIAKETWIVGKFDPLARSRSCKR